MNKKKSPPSLVFDVVVIGGGHAGVEACMITSSMKAKTLLITANEKRIAAMDCNPAMGGLAKGTVIREIDALGGVMGAVTDKTALQFKLLNTSKGPGVWSLRAQCDKVLYSEEMRKLVKKQKNLSLIEGLVSKIIIKNKRATGVQLESGQIFSAKKIILTTGTYMGSIVFRGDFSEKSGPSGEKTTSKISQQLKVIGFKLLRLKTGTPPRIIRKTIDFKKTIPVSGSDLKLAFSHKTKNYLAFSKMESCYLLATNEDTHKIVKNNLLLSPMFNRKKKGKGPRHCPSIEDKVAFFAGKKYHQLFLEPEAKILPTMYLQGLSTSLPSFVQEKILKTIPALKNCQVAKWGYAIEYDALNPIQLQPTLETKLVASLYTAGQINGTSGYEEAAAQGLIAGINAVLKLKNQKPFILKRKEAYIAVLIDDLVTKGTIEPYRLLTSQAEYRLLIRNDNAETRLLEKGYRLGTISKTTYYFFLRKKQLKQKIITFLKRKIVVKKTTSAREIFQEFGYDQKVKAETAKSILARFQVKLLPLLKILSFKKLPELKVLNFNDVTEIETEIKYAGYLEKQLKMIKQTEKFMEKKIPSSIDYEQSENITKEAKEKLSAVRPQTIFQASQIPGVTWSDIQALVFQLWKQKQRKWGSKKTV